jgi:hypothetical protein
MHLKLQPRAVKPPEPRCDGFFALELPGPRIFARENENDIIGVELEEGLHVASLMIAEPTTDHAFYYVQVHRSLGWLKASYKESDA